MADPDPIRPLVVVGEELPCAPYPPETRAAGWHFQLDTTRIRQSDTWTLARPEIRPWLLLLWMVAWEESPCGSLPADDDLIATKLGIDASLFVAHRKVLLRGWRRHRDDRLYHAVLTENVLRMCESRSKTRDRVRAWRNALVTRDQHVSNTTGSGSGSGSGSGVSQSQVASKTLPADGRRSKEAKSRATRLPKDWRCPDEWLAWAVEVYHIDRTRAVRISLAFRDYWIAKSGTNATKLDWQATWRNWMRKEMGDA